MEKERHFIRGIIPGLIFFVELSFILLLLLDKGQIDRIIKNSSNIGLPLVTFIVSGGIGFFLGILHRAWYWTIRRRDFDNIIESLMLNNFIDFLDSKGEKIKRPVTFIKNGSWRILNEIFYTRKDSKLISGPEERNDRLFDYMHSSGASFWGYLLIILTVLVILFSVEVSYNAKSYVGIIITIILYIPHYYEFKTAKKNAFHFLELVLINELLSYKEIHEKLFKIYIPKGEIERKLPGK